MILHLVSASDDQTKELLSDYGHVGLLEQGQRHSIHRSCWSKGNAAASTGAAGPFYGTTARRKQQVAAAELSVPQDLSKDYGPTGSSGRRRRFCLGRNTCKGQRAGTDSQDGYAGVHRGKWTTRPRDLPGAGRRVSPMLGILGQSFTR